MRFDFDRISFRRALMKRSALMVLALVVLGTSALAQSRLSKNGDPGSPDRPQRGSAIVRGPNLHAPVPTKPMRLIASGLTVEDFEVNPDDININADEKHRVFSTLTLDIPA